MGFFCKSCRCWSGSQSQASSEDASVLLTHRAILGSKAFLLCVAVGPWKGLGFREGHSVLAGIRPVTNLAACHLFMKAVPYRPI